jgi:hypothetical protein
MTSRSGRARELADPADVAGELLDRDDLVDVGELGEQDGRRSCLVENGLL